MERTAKGHEEWGVEALPAEVDLSRLSVERARLALGRLRAAVAACQAATNQTPVCRGQPSVQR